MPPVVSPISSSPAIPLAAGWIESVLLGNLATSMAVLAVAGLGLMALQARLHLGLGLRVLIGCVVLFGAGSIVGALMSFGRADVRLPAIEARQYAVPEAALARAPRADPDPYAGAFVPQ